ncbi:spermidine synthase [Patulibacter americanus]|uniref:spermidine synthase n=1 Tax=Patulibacter americanus TaxID=588672 RepID=UPI0003B640C3|nr:fused MFS/spermidine synthase [Patulibacter americanus]
MARRPSRRGGRAAEPVRVESGVGVLELVPDRARPGGRLLLIDGLAHGYVDLDDPTHLELDYVARIGAALEVLVPRGAEADVLHLGGGAFSLPRFLASTRPGVRQTAVERSGAVVKLAERHLRLRRSERLRVLQADGAAIVAGAPDDTYDLVLGDAFVGTETPAPMATAAFAAEVARVLRPGGRYLLNVVDQPPWPFAAEQAGFLLGAFGHALAFGGRDVMRGRHAGNVLLLASDAALPRDALARRLAGGAHPAEVVPAARFADAA